MAKGSANIEGYALYFGLDYVSQISSLLLVLRDFDSLKIVIL